MGFAICALHVALAASQASTTLSLDPASKLESRAHWSPISHSSYSLHKTPQYRSLFDFKPAQKKKILSGKDFSAFLPQEPVAVGDTWKLNDSGLVRLLEQFHPRPTTKLHHLTDAGGGYASLGALSSTLAEITFRFHAEFELDPKKSYFTPSLFTGPS